MKQQNRTFRVAFGELDKLSNLIKIFNKTHEQSFFIVDTEFDDGVEFAIIDVADADLEYIYLFGFENGAFSR